MLDLRAGLLRLMGDAREAFPKLGEDAILQIAQEWQRIEATDRRTEVLSNGLVGGGVGPSALEKLCMLIEEGALSPS